ncbi:amino acid/amide ABC transporter membrane protein 1, haat family [Halogeometricum borinquense DSM 11551]|uniref:amino acid/amide ABC transporter membrane protein 1, HAAT family n=2 Tax=Halogeometricum borinquense TaxID=60847 RepID=E4NTK6_HALBP|nr:branched-chain amino acid ABC transporter permease [Halogeometricum borinquense]ADQ67058.1 amino acid/amide ABC transporter membrane protein 1, HAAT family [Halogeometricum borinquense DSM 11551]ELY29605.1 amino acid/amide ABC transporter membrane protein 1, haat family [Halogeometricum borinquense DSM 11551]RYJ13971.1 branched-chain amino acid ABC transporter permease [Halogeometricum borinquense]
MNALLTAPLFLDALGDFLTLETLSSVLVNGLSKAALYVMLASGLTLIFGLMGVLNFAHGSLTMIGAYLGGLVMVVLAGSAAGPGTRFLAFFAAVAVAFAALSALGAVLEVGLIRTLYDRPPLYQILLTFGLTLMLDELARIVVSFYGLQPISDWQAAFATKPQILVQQVDLGIISVSGLALFEILFGVLTVVAIWAFLTQTRYGLYIRAGSEDAEMIEALGVDVRRVFTFVFAIGVGIAGVAGVLLAWDPSWGASVPLAAETLLPAFVVVIVGGLGTFRGTVVAGTIVGLVDATMTWWFQNAIAFTGLPQLTIFLILVVVLILKPQGLFGVEEVGGH